jgi:hypothetical protein
MKKFKGFEKHRKIFTILAVIVFTGALVLHATRIIAGWDIMVGNMLVPPLVSILAVFITTMMIVMGVYYICAKD